MRDLLADERRRLALGAIALYAAFAAVTFPANLHPADSHFAPLAGWSNLFLAWLCFSASVLAWWVSGPGEADAWLLGVMAAVSLAVGWPLVSADPREYVLLAHAESLGLDPLFAPYGSVAAMAGFAPMRQAAYPKLLDPYGPAFWALMRLWAFLPWQAGIWAWRIAMAALYALTGRMLLASADARSRPLVMSAYGSPFAALSLAGVGHNVMLVLALAVLVWRMGGREPSPVRLALVAAGLGLMPSFTLLGAAPALALWGMMLGRRGWRLAAPVGIAALSVFVLGYAAYGGTPLTALHDWTGPNGQSRQVFVSLGSAFTAWPGGPFTDKLTKLAAAMAAFGLFAVALVVVPDAAKADRKATLAWALPLVAALPLAFVTSVMPWYVLVPLVLATLLGNDHLWAALLPLAVSYGGAVPYLLLEHTRDAVGWVSWGLLLATAAAYLATRLWRTMPEARHRQTRGEGDVGFRTCGGDAPVARPRA